MAIATMDRTPYTVRLCAGDSHVVEAVEGKVEDVVIAAPLKCGHTGYETLQRFFTYSNQSVICALCLQGNSYSPPRAACPLGAPPAFSPRPSAMTKSRREELCRDYAQ